jgi:hypothetical protein
VLEVLDRDFTISFSLEVKGMVGVGVKVGGGGGLDLTNWVSFRCGLWRADRAHQCQGVSQKSILIRDLNGRDEINQEIRRESRIQGGYDRKSN